MRKPAHPRLSTTQRAAVEANPWFASIPSPERARLLGAAKLVHLRRGTDVYRQGDPAPLSGPGFFGLAAGVLKASTVDLSGRESVLAIAGVGNWFGEVSLIDNAPRMHFATALTAIDLLMVSREDFERLLQTSDFARAISALLAARLRSAYGMVEDTAMRSLRSRVARKLLMLAHNDLSPLPAPRTRLPLPQETLAMMLGVTRQTLSQELNALAKEGVIALHYRSIELLSLVRLEELA